MERVGENNHGRNHLSARCRRGYCTAATTAAISIRQTPFFVCKFSLPPPSVCLQTNNPDGLNRGSSWKQLVKKKDSVTADELQALRLHQAEDLINKQGGNYIQYSVSTRP